MSKRNVILLTLIIGLTSTLSHAQETFYVYTTRDKHFKDEEAVQRLLAPIVSGNSSYDNLTKQYPNMIFDNTPLNILPDFLYNVDPILCLYYVNKELVGVATFISYDLLHQVSIKSIVKRFWNRTVRGRLITSPQTFLVNFACKEEYAEKLLRKSVRYLQNNNCVYIGINTPGHIISSHPIFEKAAIVYNKAGFKCSNDGCRFYIESK
ncbi:MAG: hypothetical protein ACHQVS_05075 [Candidatus Babeliales bacterium]